MSRVNQFGLRLFGDMVWKLLIIEQKFQWKFNKINFPLNMGVFLVFLVEALGKSNLIEFISQILELMCER